METNSHTGETTTDIICGGDNELKQIRLLSHSSTYRALWHGYNHASKASDLQIKQME